MSKKLNKRGMSCYRYLIGDEVFPLTTILGLKCNNGIVIASDSQSSYVKGLELKKLDQNKIFPITNNLEQASKYILAGSGVLSQIETLVSRLKLSIADREFNNRSLKEVIEQTLLELHRKYNVDRARFLGLPEVEMFFKPSALLGAKLLEDNEVRHELYCLYPDGWVAQINEYETIGSGSALADLLMKQIKRIILASGRDWSTIDTEIGCIVGSYVINEVKGSDRNSGGSTLMGYINKDKFQRLSEDEVASRHKTLEESLIKMFREGIKEIPEEDIKKMLAKP